MSNMFPRQIWDGSSPTRNDASQMRSPDAADWQVLTEEVKAIEKYLLDLADNLEVMPNLSKELDKKTVLLQDYENRLSRLVPPENLQVAINGLDKRIGSLEEMRERFQTLKTLVQAVQQQLFVLNTDYRKFKKSVTEDMEIFQNEMRRSASRFERSVNTLLERVLTRVNEISEILSFNQLLKDDDE